MSGDVTKYVGTELDLFARAVNWKRYWSSQIKPYVAGDVVEVGAGVGANTPYLRSSSVTTWLCVEPDPDLARRIPVRNGNGHGAVEVVVGTLGDVGPERTFDAVLYVDALEHVEDDRAEIRQAAARLRHGGRLIVLAPAHGWLFSEFDRAIGHFRRYTRESLTAIMPSTVETEDLFYLDSCGMLVSFCNRLLLRQSIPTARQIAIWDAGIVTCSRFVDRMTMRRFGKSVVGVWRKRAVHAR